MKDKIVGIYLYLTACNLQLANGSITSLLNEQGELRKDVLDKLNKVYTTIATDSIYDQPSLQLQSMEIEPIPSIGELFK